MKIDDNLKTDIIYGYLFLHVMWIPPTGKGNKANSQNWEKEDEKKKWEWWIMWNEEGKNKELEKNTNPLRMRVTETSTSRKPKPSIGTEKLSGLDPKNGTSFKCKRWWS